MSSVSGATASAAPAPSRAALGIALACVYLIWGSTYLFIRLALAGYPPLLLGGTRFLIAGVALFIWLRLRGTPFPTATQWANCAVVGVLLLSVGNGLVCIAEQSAPSALAAIALASMPLWIGVFASLYGRKPTRNEWLGMAIGFGGVVLLNVGGDFHARPASMLALVIAAISWAFGSIWSRGRDLPLHLMSTAAQMLCGGAVMLVVGAALGEHYVPNPPLHATLALAYLTIVGSLMGFGAYVYLLTRARPALATSYAYVNPPIAVLLGVFVAGEVLSPVSFIAMGVILAGVLVISRPPAAR
jgi:drug/metabolite transporter (DMT)-like permease